MLAISEMAAIAGGYATAMADAMIAACLAWSLETGCPLELPERPRLAPPVRAERPAEDVEWREMVERNGDTRWCHV